MSQVDPEAAETGEVDGMRPLELPTDTGELIDHILER
jgi:hypothetical protein